MKYFLTGATGFVGKRLAQMLKERGHEVVAVVRSPDKADDLKAIGVSLVKGDVAEKESMRQAMQGCDGVFHVAAWYKLGQRDKTPGWKTNVEGTRNVLELVRELNIPKCVYTSTLAINSDTHGAIRDETFRFTGRHISEYDRTKAAAHEIADQFIKEGLPLVILMPGLIYGPGGTSLSDEAFRLYLKKQLPVIPARSAYSWAHVDDIAGMHITAMEKAASGSTYSIAGPCHTMIEAYQMAYEITGIRKPIAVPTFLTRSFSLLAGLVEIIIPMPELYTSETLGIQGSTYLGDNSKAKRELGYNPRPLRQGLEETLRYELAKTNGKKK
ncbi:MAG: NAD-dependent epimerase/dehydratase family protein [Saprospirales bacterium]|nr:NAD-dependent epimerase/dehydratase family protein [Saprospirales bacterium]